MALKRETPRFAEAVFRHRPSQVERVYFVEARYALEQAMLYLSEDPRNARLRQQDFELVGYRPPEGPTDARDADVVILPPPETSSPR